MCKGYLILWYVIDIWSLPSHQVVLVDLRGGGDGEVLLVMVLPQWPVRDTFHWELGSCRVPSIRSLNTEHEQENIMALPIDDKVCPKVAHDSGNFPIFIVEVEDSSGEKVEELIAVSDTTRNGRLLTGEQKVPQ